MLGLRWFRRESIVVPEEAIQHRQEHENMMCIMWNNWIASGEKIVVRGLHLLAISEVPILLLHLIALIMYRWLSRFFFSVSIYFYGQGYLFSRVGARGKKERKGRDKCGRRFCFIFFLRSKSPNGILAGCTCFIMAIQWNFVAGWQKKHTSDNSSILIFSPETEEASARMGMNRSGEGTALEMRRRHGDV